MDGDLLQRVSSICLAWPEAHAVSLTGQHTAFEVRGKRFAYFLVDHHGDGRLAVQCKTLPGVQPSLVEADPERFFIPPYLGPRGWVGIDVGFGEPDWDEVAGLLEMSYRMTAPKRLVAQLPQAASASGYDADS